MMTCALPENTPTTTYLKVLADGAYLARYNNHRAVNVRRGLLLILQRDQIEQRFPVQTEEDAIATLDRLTSAA